MKLEKLAPAFQDYLWGGTKLRDVYGKRCDFDKVAESWELSTHPAGESTLAGGERDGLPLGQYFQQFPQALGKNAAAFESFPVLIKLIDAKEPLSIQVHPSDEYALRVEGEYGKTEMWVIVDCDPGAFLYFGVNRPVSKEEFRQRIENNTVLEVLNKVEVHPGDVFFIQSISGDVNDALMELLIMIDALRRASAGRITAVDRKAAPREPITARLVANLLERAGVDRVITLDLHQGQIQGFFDIPVNHLSALPLFGEYYNNMHFDTDNLVVVSPDVGRAKAAKKLSDMLDCSLAIAHKGRPRHNAAEVMGIIGDIEGKTCIINDDMIDTAGTLCASVRELKKMGAGDIYVCATHGIFSGPAIERLNDAPIVECVVTDSIPVEAAGKIKTITVADEFANAIAAVYDEESVSKLVGGDFAM